MTLYEDKKSTIRLISHTDGTEQARRASIQHGQGSGKKNNITIKYLPSELMTADTLT